MAFLRAINVGGHTVKMERLRELFEELGFSAVETFIAPPVSLQRRPGIGLEGAAMASAQFFTFLIGTTVDLFYRRRLLAGSSPVPASGPILLVANHPNAMVDPIVVQNVVVQTAGRRVRMLAKSTLWKMPGVSILVKGMESLPVYRPKDGSDPKQNAQTFRAVEEALVNGAAVLIFPEGISHDEPSVQPLKTGAARIAMGALAQGARDILIIPVGLSYADKLRFRSTAAVDIGTPLRVADFVPPAQASEDEQRAAVKKLTEAIRDGLHQVTINLESWEDLPLLEAVDAIWRQQDSERTRRLKVLADGTALLRQQDPAYFDDLRTRLADWLLRLRQLGLRSQDVAEGAVQARKNPLKLALFAARNVLALTIGLPFALWGSIFWSLPFWTVHLVWYLWRAERDVGATVKVLGALVIFPLWYAISLSFLARYLTPGALLLTALVSPAAGMMTRHFFRRRFFAAQQLLTFMRLGLQGKLLEDVVQEREGFYREIEAIAKRVKTETPGSIR